MNFLIQDDFDKLIRQDVLDRVTQNDAGILYDAELAAIAEMQSYLAVRFDVANIFNRTGTERNALLVMYLTDMLLYHIHSRINPRQIPNLRAIRYEAAIKWLEMVAAGKLSPNLPGIASPDESQTGTVSYTGPKKRDNFIY